MSLYDKADRENERKKAINLGRELMKLEIHFEQMRARQLLLRKLLRPVNEV